MYYNLSNFMRIDKAISYLFPVSEQSGLMVRSNSSFTHMNILKKHYPRRGFFLSSNDSHQRLKDLTAIEGSKSEFVCDISSASVAGFK